MNITRFFAFGMAVGLRYTPRLVKEDLVALNRVNFEKMAYGDPEGLRELAFDYFNDTRRLMTGWRVMIDRGELASLREELHRCKGGASLFGLERIVALIGDCEKPRMLETEGFDLVVFEKELSAAEQAVEDMVESVS